MATLTVAEASDTYANAMRNPAAVHEGVCRVCRTFIDPAFPTCYSCGHHPENLDTLVPITYSIDRGQMHAALRGYKDDWDAATHRYHAIRLTAILWRFLENHEACVARAAGTQQFDVVTTVPSKSTERDEERHWLRTIVGAWSIPIRDRYRRLLFPNEPPSLERAYSHERYRASPEAAGASVLLIDDTWTTGSCMQSAAAALRAAGAITVAGLVIGRHLNPKFGGDWGTSDAAYRALDPVFSWETCAVHQ